MHLLSPLCMYLSILTLLVVLIATYEKAQGSLLGDETPLDERDRAEADKVSRPHCCSRVSWVPVESYIYKGGHLGQPPPRKQTNQLYTHGWAQYRTA